MKIELTKKPQGAALLEGFPGFGLVGTITSEFLIEHLETEQIGSIWFDNLPAIAAIHKGNVVQPIGIFYNEKYNFLILHVITNITGFEWKMVDAIKQLCDDLKIREIISIEGVASSNPDEEPKVFYHTTIENNDKIKNIGANPLQEGIIMGVTGALLMKSKLPLTCLFADTKSQLPDSAAAAKIIEYLDKYIGLEVDYAPLKEQAEKFETQLKGLMESGKKIKDLQDAKKMSYVG